MAQPVFKTVTAPPKLKDQVLGSLQAAGWARRSEPPLGEDKAGAYAAALARTSEGGADFVHLGRALLWCDLQSRVFRPSCAAAYLAAAAAHPADERCAFYAAALAVHTPLQLDDDQKQKLHARLMNPAWRKSSLWGRLRLSRDDALDALAASSADVDVLEEALRAAPERAPDRRKLARRLGTLYRAESRRDEGALKIVRYLFLNEPGDEDNALYLAECLADSGADDPDSAPVFTRALEICDLACDEAGSGRWVRLLARRCLETGRLDQGSFPVLWRAHRLSPDERLLEAAAAYAAVLNEHLWREVDVLKLLCDVVAFEAEIRPLFVERRWRWEALVRALALAWGGAGRNDRAAHIVYARAAELCPEDRQLWGHYANALAAARDTSPAAIHVYERARAGGSAGDLVLAMLGHGYLTARAHQTPSRTKALAVWQELFVRGVAGPEIAEVLGDALAENGDASEIAVRLWESVAAREPDNGRIRRHLAEAMRGRGALSESVRWYREAAALLPQDFAVQLECARLMRDSTADSEEVVRLMERATALPEGERSLEAHVLLGEALADVERRDDAREIFRRIVDELDPSHTRSLLMLGRLSLRYQQEGVEEAGSLYARALEQEPDNPETYRRLAELYREEGETRLEQAAREKYLTLTSGDSAQYRQLADLYMRRGEWDQAESALRQVIQMGEGDKKTYSLLGEVLHARSRAA